MEDVIHHTNCPALVARGRKILPPASIVLREDTSPEATEAGELAASIGWLFEAEVYMVYIPHAPKDLKKRMLSTPASSRKHSGRRRKL